MKVVKKFYLRLKMRLKSLENKMFLEDLKVIISKIKNINKDKIKLNSNLYKDLGIDSLSRIELVAKIDKKYRIKFNENLITKKTTIKDLVFLIEKNPPVKKLVRYSKINHTFPVKLLRFFGMQMFPFIIVRLFSDLSVEGLENLRKIKSPILFIANHTSYGDQPCLLKVMPLRFKYNVASPAYYDFFYPDRKKVGFFKYYFKRLAYHYSTNLMGLFEISQNHSFKEMMDHLLFVIDKNENLLLFPEGEMTRDNKMKKFKHGAAYIIKKTGISVIPIGIIGLNKVFPPDQNIPKRGPVNIKFGKLIKFSKNDSLENITKELEKRIWELSKDIYRNKLSKK